MTIELDFMSIHLRKRKKKHIYDLRMSKTQYGIFTSTNNYHINIFHYVRV